jgi:hypothetical protein
MSETPHNEPTSSADTTASSVEPSTESDAASPAVEPAAEPAAEPSPAPAATESSASARPASRFARWGTAAALLLAIIATGVAVAGWFYPHKSASSTPTYSDQQTKDAKKHMCETFMVVDRAVVRNSRLKNPDNGGPIGALSVATAARLAFYGGGAYLKDRVSQEPATPPDLAKSINAMGSNLEELAIGYLAGAAEFTQDELRQALDDKIKATVEICKKQ